MKGNITHEYRQINTKDIVVDPNGQRNVESRQAQFKKIMKTFNPLLVNAVKVGEVNRRYYCFDGQQTMKVLKERNGGRDCMVECKVFYGLTLPEIAELFLLQNGTQAAVEQIDKLRVQYHYGDPDVVQFVRNTERNGIRIDWTKGNAKNKVVAVASLYDVWKKFNDQYRYAEYCHVLRTAWDGSADSFRREILNGLYIFMDTFKGMYQEKILIKKLSEVSPQKIIRDGAISNASGYRKYAVQIFNAYNDRSRTNRLPCLL